MGKELRDREYEHRVRWISEPGGRVTERVSYSPARHFSYWIVRACFRASISRSRRDARSPRAPPGGGRRVEEGGHSFYRARGAGRKNEAPPGLGGWVVGDREGTVKVLRAILSTDYDFVKDDKILK